MNINISFINIFNFLIFIIYLHHYNKISSKIFCNDVKYLNQIKISNGSYRSLSDMYGMAYERRVLLKPNSYPYDDEKLSNDENVIHKIFVYTSEKLKELYQNENEINKMNSANIDKKKKRNLR
ncbi:Plasmodium exported protein, unknown function [Plasmodium reichenowi]|uniref:Putative exported protein n=1 Tax=Plasmodium reichenowi TaxID=5854 RepID=A0A151LRB1_PLARE|nr:putative exported protein [Plasmodium reichenowi]KYO01711.1 putative exported protein [Plasmodium reichenowi]SOV84151.1 Plasmodium exported protein, unknown function [Plasmodium reichenowi]